MGCSRPRRRSAAGTVAAARVRHPGGLGVGRRRSRATHSVAVLKATRWPARQARIPRAMLRCVLPVPRGPKQDDVLFAGEKVELAEVLDQGFMTLRWNHRPLSTA